jgi:hypothetical protein
MTFGVTGQIPSYRESYFPSHGRNVSINASTFLRAAQEPLAIDVIY